MASEMRFVPTMVMGTHSPRLIIAWWEGNLSRSFAGVLMERYPNIAWSHRIAEYKTHFCLHGVAAVLGPLCKSLFDRSLKNSYYQGRQGCCASQ